MIRLDALESKQTGIDQRLDKVDSNLEALGVSVFSQFTAALRSLGELTELQRTEERKRPQANVLHKHLCETQRPYVHRPEHDVESQQGLP